MPVRWKPVALLALVPALALGAPRKPPAKKPPAKKPVATEPAATPDASAADGGSAGGTKDKAPDAPAITPPAGGAATGGAATGGGSTTVGGSDASSSGSGSRDATRGGVNPPAPPAERGRESPLPIDPAADAQGGDVDALRQEYLGLRDELFKSRARANAVASQLYSTRIQVKLTYTTGRYYNPGRSSIRLDGANVYEDATGAIAGDDGVRFDGYIAPGRHLITFRVEAAGKDDDSFTSMTESQVVVKAVAGKDLLVSARARDSGDIAYEWKRTEHGSYGLGIDVAVMTAKAVETAPVATPAPRGTKK